jgi:hypothetical protein
MEKKEADSGMAAVEKGERALTARGGVYRNWTSHTFERLDVPSGPVTSRITT